MAARLTSTQLDNGYADSHHTGAQIRTEKQICMWCSMLISICYWLNGQDGLFGLSSSSIMKVLVWSSALIVENQDFPGAPRSSALFLSSHLTLFPLPAGRLRRTMQSDAEVRSALPFKAITCIHKACGSLLISPGAWSETLGGAA